MAIRDKKSGGGSGHELRNFTDRENELAIFNRMLDLDEPAHLPAVMFFGVGGTGKSWLLKRLREGTTLPSAYVDFDRRSGGPSYVNDFAMLLAEIWRQFDVECPRFEMAYAWMRFKQGAMDRPLARHSGKASTGWELVKEGASAGMSSIPGANLFVWAADKLGKVAVERIKRTTLGAYLLTQLGNDDYLRLERQAAQEIYPTLITRLGEDLSEGLPGRGPKRCRAVLFLDTLEDVAGGEQNDARRQITEEPIRELYKHLPHVLLVMFGRDRLTWDKVDPEWADRLNLEQHSLEGLSRHDAEAFLGKCDISLGPLLEAILRVSRDVTNPSLEAYYPLGLGLCADTVQAEVSRDVEPSPDTFDMASGDYGRLSQRFLKSLHGDHPEGWIIDLAQTPRFDEAAARAAFSSSRDAHQDQAWESLRDYSFIQEAAEPGWHRIHSVMADALRHKLDPASEAFARAHTDWQAYWRSRSQGHTDDFAALAWYHQYALEPKQAALAWTTMAIEARTRASMRTHWDLLDWWTPTKIEREPPTADNAEALLALGFELWAATLGNATRNLRRAITCFESALRVYTEEGSPSEWAMTQNNLGNAYSDLPSGDRGKNLQLAIDCYNAALRVHTEASFPSGWAMTQNNLGNAYRALPSGDRGKNLQLAIDCYNAALRVRTEEGFPSEWAKTQNNLGNAYSDLPSGDRGKNLQLAIDCYNAALRVHTEACFPSGWAMTQLNLGNAYSALPPGVLRDNIRRAIECFESALLIYTEADFPSEWAKTQNNLGVAYSDLPSGDRGKNLQFAIDCHNAALRVRTESDYPSDWAETMNNLGIAYFTLTTGDRGDNLRSSIAYLETALRVQTEEAFPSDRAITQFNLGLILREAGRINESVQAFESAARGFENVGDRDKAEQARSEAEKTRRGLCPPVDP